MSLADISKIKDFIQEKEKAIQDLSFQNELLKENLVNAIQKYVHPVRFRWKDILHYICHKTEDSREYDLLCSFLAKRLHPDFEKKNFITNLDFFCYEITGYNIEFFIKDIKFSLFIPNVENININNYILAHYGEYQLFYYETKNCSKVLSSSYDLKVLREDLEKFLNNV